MALFTTWEEWLGADAIPLRDAVSIMVCGPRLPDCELSRAGICAVVNRGIGVLEQWRDLQGCGLCQGIEKAREVARINSLTGLSPQVMHAQRIGFRDFVKWGMGKRIPIPQELLNASLASATPPAKQENLGKIAKDKVGSSAPSADDPLIDSAIPPQPPAGQGGTLITSEAVSVPTVCRTGLDLITQNAWLTAIEEYEAQPGRRANDALPERMRVYLRRLKGEQYASIEQKKKKKRSKKDDVSVNLSAMLKKAETEDAPKLNGLFPQLPDLPKL